MSKVFVGGITPEGERLVNMYLEKFMPDAVIEPLKAAGIRGRIKNHAKRPDVALVIIDESLYEQCRDVASDVLAMPKVHKYVNDEGLKQFLISKFGVIKGVDTGSSTPIGDNVEIKQSVSSNRVDESLDFGDISEESSDESFSAEYVNKLRMELEQSQLLVRNLSEQLQGGGTEDDVKALVQKIRTLQDELTAKDKTISDMEVQSYTTLGKITKAEGVLEESKSLRVSLKESENKVSELESMITELKSSKEKLEQTVEELNTYPSKLDSLRGEYNSLSEKLSSCKLDYDTKCDEYDELLGRYNNAIESISEKDKKVEELSGAVDKSGSEVMNLNLKLKSSSEEIERLGSKISQLEKSLSEKSEDLTECEKDCSSLREKLALDHSEVRSKVSEIEELTAKLGSIEDTVNEKDLAISSMTNENKKLKAEGVDLKAKISELTSEVDKLSKQLSDIKDSNSTKVQNLSTEIESLKSRNTELGGKISSLTEELEIRTKSEESLRSELQSFKDSHKFDNAYVEGLESKLNDLEIEYKAISDKFESSSKENDSLTKRVEGLITELGTAKSDNDSEVATLKSSMSDNLAEMNSLKRKLDLKDAELTDLHAQLDEIKSSSESKLAEYKTKVSDLQNELSAKTDKILELNASARETEANSSSKEDYNNIIKELAKVKEERDNLEDEVKILGVNKTKNAELRARVSELESQLESTESSSTDTEEVKRLRKKCSDLELNLVDKTEELKEINSSVFTQLLNCALPKVMLDTGVDIPSDLGKGFNVIGGGSAESNLFVYKALSGSCKRMNDKKILIVDLSTDSYIDAEFKVHGIQSPIDWLSGSTDFKNFISDTMFGNVKVLSVGLAYLNPLYLLCVDWGKRLNELKGFADIIVFNVGCLNSVVSKVLFQSFASKMNSHVVVKATPINIRTSILTLAGMQCTDETFVYCMNFDNTSKSMYQRLAQKYRVSIFAEDSIMELS